MYDVFLFNSNRYKYQNQKNSTLYEVWYTWSAFLDILWIFVPINWGSDGSKCSFTSYMVQFKWNEYFPPFKFLINCYNSSDTILLFLLLYNIILVLKMQIKYHFRYLGNANSICAQLSAMTGTDNLVLFANNILSKVVLHIIQCKTTCFVD